MLDQRLLIEDPWALIADQKESGSGSFAKVYKTADKNKMLKIGTYEDDILELKMERTVDAWIIWATYCLMTEDDGLDRFYMPKIDKLVIDVHTWDYFAIVEKLEEQPEGHYIDIFTTDVLERIDTGNNYVNNMFMDDSEMLVAMYGNHWSTPDLHSDNIMMRGDQFVLNDPFAFTKDYASERLRDNLLGNFTYSDKVVLI